MCPPVEPIAGPDTPHARPDDVAILDRFAQRHIGITARAQVPHRK